MEIPIVNEVIKKVNVIKEEEDFYLGLNLYRIGEGVQIPIIDLKTIQMLLEFLGNNSLSDIKDIPVRILLKELDDEQFEVIAISDFLDDRCLMLDSIAQTETSNFDEMFANNAMAEANLNVGI